jgi:hypothetical protein
MGNVQYPARFPDGLHVDQIGRQIFWFTGVEMIFAAYPIIEDVVSIEKAIRIIYIQSQYYTGAPHE